jgi:hypothetical protein
LCSHQPPVSEQKRQISESQAIRAAKFGYTVECIQEQDRAGPAGRKNNEEQRKPENNEAGARTTRSKNNKQRKTEQ